MNRTTVLAGLGLGALLLVSRVAAADAVGWHFDADATGVVTKMTVDNPATPLGIEREIVVELSHDGNVTGGTVQFASAPSRAMPLKEADTYWRTLSGQRAMWDYYEAQGLLKALSTGQAIPSDWLGRKVRLVSTAGNEVVGILMAAGQEYEIKVEDSSDGPVHFIMDAAKKLQTMKS